MSITKGPWRAEWEYEKDQDARRIFRITGHVLLMVEQRVFADLHLETPDESVLSLILAAPDLLAAAKNGDPAALAAAIHRARRWSHI